MGLGGSRLDERHVHRRGSGEGGSAAGAGGDGAVRGRLDRVRADRRLRGCGKGRQHSGDRGDDDVAAPSQGCSGTSPPPPPPPPPLPPPPPPPEPPPDGQSPG